MRLRFFSIFFITLVIVSSADAQLCQGSLGDPIINTTFGNGANPGPALSAATTAYQYVAGDCPNDGFYTVRNNTNSCFGNSWHSFSSDHTGDPGGYFMLVNASIQPSAFYLDTVRGLCGNTTYEFAAWIMNVLLPSACSGSGIQPNLTFSIEKTDGTVLQTYNSGSIPSTSSPAWKQYGFFFTTPVASDIVLRIFNNSQGGCGNDLALDDITFRPCGPLINNQIDGGPATVHYSCQGPAVSALLSCNVSGGFTNPVFRWQTRIPQNSNIWLDIVPPLGGTSIGFAIAPNAPPGTYEARLAVAEAGNLGSPQCRIYSQPFTFVINANPVTTATNNGPACERTTATLTATGGTQYDWTGPGGFNASGSSVQLANMQLINAGKYYVVVTNAAGCTSLDSTIIMVNTSPVATTTFSNASVCFGDSLQLIGGGGPGYNWIPATGLSNSAVFNPKASPATTTLYSVIVTNAFSCSDTADVIINVIADPLVDAGPDRIMLQGQPIRLNGNVTGQGYTFTWSPPVYIDDVFALQPTVNPPADMRYILTAVSNAGCKTVADSMLVKVYPEIFVPNAFTPNADGLNDTWNIPALAAYPNFELFVYSRYGELVFRTKNTPISWDGTCKGKPCLNGTYTYLIKTGDDRNMMMGTVVIIR